jgi:D-lactate dehydrogenase (cytochrome)
MSPLLSSQTSVPPRRLFVTFVLTRHFCLLCDMAETTNRFLKILNTGVAIQCVELCDDQFMRATNTYGISERKYPEMDSLFFKFQGSPETIQETSRVVGELIKKHGATGFEVAETEQQALDLWTDRKNALFSSLALLPGGRGWSTDVCGTRSQQSCNLRS